MPITNSHLAWFRLKCPYQRDNKPYKRAYAMLNNASYADLEKLRAEFDEYDDGSVPVRHYKHKGQWYAKPLTGGIAQKLNMKGIQQYGRKWRVQKRTNGQFRKWTYGSFEEAQTKRDLVFSWGQKKQGLTKFN